MLTYIKTVFQLILYGFNQLWATCQALSASVRGFWFGNPFIRNYVTVSHAISIRKKLTSTLYICLDCFTAFGELDGVAMIMVRRGVSALFQITLRLFIFSNIRVYFWLLYVADTPFSSHALWFYHQRLINFEQISASGSAQALLVPFIVPSVCIAASRLTFRFTIFSPDKSKGSLTKSAFSLIENSRKGFSIILRTVELTFLDHHRATGFVSFVLFRGV